MTAYASACTAGRAGRTAAITALALGLLHLEQLPHHAAVARYLGILFATTVTGFLVSAVRLWYGGHFDGRALAGGLSALALGAQLLSLTVGLPGLPELHGRPTVPGVVAMVLEATTIAALLRARRLPGHDRTESQGLCSQ
jgi:hypothetical protein